MASRSERTHFPQPEIEQTSNTLPELGVDSLGNTLYEGNLIYSQEPAQPLQVRQVSTGLSLQTSEKNIRIDHSEDTSEALSSIKVNVGERSTWVPLTELRSWGKKSGQVPWEKIGKLVYHHIKLTDYPSLRKEGELSKEETLEQLLQGAPMLDEGHLITGFHDAGSYIEMDLYRIGDTQTSMYIDKERGFTAFTSRGQHRYYVLWQNDTREYLVPARPEIDPELPDAQKIDVDRNASREAILAFLQKSFPWMEDGDLQISHLPQSEIPSPVKQMATADWNRLHAFYPSRDSQEYIDAYKNPTSSEIMYLASRNYARLVEFAVYAAQAHEHTDASFTPDFSRTNVQERARLASEIIANLEQKMLRLSAERRLMELELFGSSFPDTSTHFLDRFTSGDTVSSSAYGLYTWGLTNLITTSLDGTAKYEHVFSQPPERRREEILNQVADIMAHENGHMRAKHPQVDELNTRVPPELTELTHYSLWKHEEIWNEWKSVLLPHMLLHEGPAFTSAYQFSPNGHERGGAWKIQEMIEELVSMSQKKDITIERYSQGELTGSDKLTTELILQSALATALRRQEYGPIEIAGHEVEGFGSLYDFVMNTEGEQLDDDKEKYAQKLRGLSDDDYGYEDPPRDNDASSPHETLDLIQHLNLQLVEHILTQARAQLSQM